MKSLKFLILLLATLSSINSYSQNTKAVKKPNAKSVQTKNTSTQNKGTHMTFEKEVIQLGKIKKGDVKKFDFVFTNTGTDVIEVDIASGCDCTDIEYPRNKILPGKKGVLNITFNSGKKEGNEKSTDVDLYLKNVNPATGQRILKILKFEYEFIM